MIFVDEVIFSAVLFVVFANLNNVVASQNK